MAPKSTAENDFNRIRRMILGRALLAPTIVLILVCGMLVYHFAGYSRRQVRLELSTTASGHLRLVDQFLKERAADLIFAAASKNFHDLDRPEVLAQTLSDLQTGSRAFPSDRRD